MKTRKGFVSNSSSSSFICDLSGESFEDGGEGLHYCGAVECEHGHIFFYRGYPLVEAWVNSADDFDADDDGDDDCRDDGQLPERFCPICQKDPNAVAMIVERMKDDMKHCNITVEQLK